MWKTRELRSVVRKGVLGLAGPPGQVFSENRRPTFFDPFDDRVTFCEVFPGNQGIKSLGKLVAPPLVFRSGVGDRDRLETLSISYCSKRRNELQRERRTGRLEGLTQVVKRQPAAAARKHRMDRSSRH